MRTYFRSAAVTWGTGPSATAEARQAMHQAARLQRDGNLGGAIELYQKGISLVADASDLEGIGLRIHLREQKAAADRLHREEVLAAA